MTPAERVRLSKFMSLVLRHQPEVIGVTLDAAGWVAVDELVAAMVRHGTATTAEQIRGVVALNDKQRFALSPDGLRIRASQGHSVQVELAYAPQAPPDVLFHGTPKQVVPLILQEGLRKMKRHHVHLSPDRETAMKVGGRRGKPVILVVDSARMARDGHTFFRSANGVWLTEHVAPRYLSVESRV
ncbi:MAG: RNA 2'-phosphotransferase [Myxococcota bacterium]